MKKQYMFILCLFSLITLPAFQGCERCCSKSHSHGKEHKHEATDTTSTPITPASEQTPLDTEVTSEK